jgi:hypothetical protein
MTAIPSANNPLARDNRAPAPAVHEDGTNYPWRMFYENNRRIVDADTTAEVLDFLIPGYLLLDTEEERLTARTNLARSVQQLGRATIAANITPDESEKITDWEWTILTYGEGDAQDPYGWGDGTGELGSQDEETLDWWTSVHPLVLLDTSYAPFTEIIKPLSGEGDYIEVNNLIWLRPSTELSLLRSLSRIGYITFGTPSAVVADEVARKN